MKAKLFYWIPTALFALLMGFSGVFYLSGAPEVVAGFAHLGYPDYFRVFLGSAKLVGAVLLIAPLGRELKQLAYAGFAFNLTAAVASHVAVGDPVGDFTKPVLPAVLLLLSYVAWRYRNRTTAEVASNTSLAQV